MVSTITEVLTKQRPLYEGRHVTVEEYFSLPDDGFLYDMIEGVLHVSPSADYHHGRQMGNIFSVVRAYLKRFPIADLTQETDISWPDGKDVLRPDLSIILNENLPIVHRHIYGVPDIVVEVLSPGTSKRDLTVKADRYLRNRVKEYWIVDPKKRTLSIWYNENENWEKSTADCPESRVLPGLLLVPADIFD